MRLMLTTITLNRTAAVRFSIASIEPAIIPHPVLQTLGNADLTSLELGYPAMGPAVS